MDSGALSQQAEPTLVHRIGPGHAVVLAPPGVLGTLGDVVSNVPADVMQAMRTAAVAAPGLQGVAEQLTGGLVRLTADSQRLLAEYGPELARDGGILGVVRGADGRFTGVLTFENVGRLAEVAPQLPALFGAAALQLQLVAIERKLDDIHESIDALVRDSQIEVLAEARAGLTILRDVYLDATETGHLTEDDWARAARVELSVRTLHEQASAQLKRIDAVLISPDRKVADRLRALREASRNDRARFWFEAYVVAEAALSQWEAVRLIRLSVTDDHRLWREVEESRTALEERRDFVRALTDHLAGYLSDAGRVDGLLDRLRIVRRARLDRLILELDEVLDVYQTWIPQQGPLHGPTLESSADLALPVPESGLEWAELARVSRQRSSELVSRTAAIAGDAVSTAGGVTMRALRSARATVRRIDAEESASETPDA